MRLRTPPFLGLLALLGLSACAPSGSSSPRLQPVAESRHHDLRRGRDVSFTSMMRDAQQADVIFFGEQHDDPATHRSELAVLAALGSGDRGVILSLEMFERDVQGLLDDYLAGRVTEAAFLAGSRPWERYTTDYRALVELARARGWRVVAANVPRRHASTVSRKGLGAVDSLPPAERATVAREIACPRDSYYARFADQMKGHSAGGGPPAASDSATMRAMTDRFYEAQCLKDETMAEAIVAARRASPGAIILHVDGAFHSDFGLGTAERVRRRAPEARLLVLSAVPVDDPASARPADHAGRGDFLLFTRKPPAPRAP